MREEMSSNGSKERGFAASRRGWRMRLRPGANSPKIIPKPGLRAQIAAGSLLPEVVLISKLK